MKINVNVKEKIKNLADKQIIALHQKHRERDYWLRKLSGDLEKTIFPYDYDYQNKNIGGKNEVQTVPFNIPGPIASNLIKVSNNSDSRLFMVLVAGLIVLLNKYSGTQDIIVGAPIYKQDIEGEFINTLLVLRDQIEDNMTFKELILQVKQTITEAAEHQSYPIEVLPEQLNMQADGNGFPLFDVAILLENIHDKKYLRHIPLNMIFHLRRTDGYVEGNIEYNSFLYQKATVERIIRHYNQLLQEALFNISVKVPDMEILGEEEKRQLLFDFNNTDTQLPIDKTVVQLFEDQAERTPVNIAVESEQETLTFEQLDERANQVANYLNQAKRIESEDRVGILMDRSPLLVAAILGILKAGAAYVPIEPSLPEARIKYIINDAGIGIVISQVGYIKTLNRLQWECPLFHTYLCIDSTDIYSEEEKKSELMNETLWDSIVEAAIDEVTAGGWFTSYTGQPFTEAEMDEFGDNVLKKLAPILRKDMRVLEIGCASGITMYRIAPRVGFYHGIDLSKVTIEKNIERVEKEGYQNIKLSCLPAHEIHKIEEKNFDLVIINSVVQSFHGHNYLRGVICKAVEVLKRDGWIFIGDVMDQDLKEALTAEMIAFKQANIGKNYLTKTDWSTELFVSRPFFEDLSAEIPEIKHVEFSKKIYTIENELTKFRYDTLMSIRKTTDTPGKSEPRRILKKHKCQEDLRELEKFAAVQSFSFAHPHNLAYIIYTSGTTGKSKGVIIEHQALTNYISWAAKTYVKNGIGNFPLFTSISFDLTMTSIFTPLVTGFAIVVYEDRESEKVMLIDNIVEKNNVHIVKLTPSHLKVIREKEMEGLQSNIKGFIAGGENLDAQLAEDICKNFNGNVDIYNEYGPTEATIGCMIYTYTPQNLSRKSVPIGQPSDNAQIYLLDKNRKPIPPGGIGEMYVSGYGIARGYMNQPELTAERFVPNSFIPGKPMYKTGDLGRRLPDGNIEFVGRIDQQVKVRGYRIELGEIEEKLKKYNPSIHNRSIANENVVNTANTDIIHNCTRCALPSNYPENRFDEQGTCSICREYDTYKEEVKNYFKDIEDFKKILQKARKSNQSRYDCLLLYSGGKDSSYVLYRLVEMGLKVLAFTFDNGFISLHAFENIKRITSALNVDSIIRKTQKMDEIFVESLRSEHDVCNGCFKAVNTIGTQIAIKKGINVVVTGMSKGQIFDIKLHGLFRLGVFDEDEIEKQHLLFRKNYHSMNNKTSALLGIELKDTDLEQIHFVDFFRYDHTSVGKIKEFLKRKDKYWHQPEDTGFCSTNCIINDVGIYVHLKNRGYHNYAAQLSWDCRLGVITPKEVSEELRFDADLPKMHQILHEIGYLKEPGKDFRPVKDAVVIDRDDKNGDKYLCAYIESSAEINETELREFLSNDLPDYMIPSYFVWMGKIPLTSNGKIDRKALPGPEIKAGDEYIAPRNELEEKLAQIWSEVLGIEKEVIGIDSNFFDLGGQSLNATIMAGKIHKEFNVSVSLAEIFKTPTINGITAAIEVIEWGVNQQMISHKQETEEIII